MPTCSQRCRALCSLWRLEAFLDLMYPRQGVDPKSGVVSAVQVSAILLDCILPMSLQRFRRLVYVLLEERPVDREAILGLIGPQSDFERCVLAPSSYEAFEDAFDGTFSISQQACIFGEMEKVFARWGASTPSPSSLSAQFLIEGLDCWMSSRADGDNDQMVLACGVSPQAIAEGKKIRPTAAIDFVIDVVFPQQRGVSSEGSDWLVDAHARAVSACPDAHRDLLPLTCSGVTQAQASANCEVADATPNSRRRARSPVPPSQIAVNDDGHHSQDYDDADMKATDDVVVTKDNLEAILHANPSALPWEIVVEKRKSLLDPALTLYELTNHYQADELVAFIERMVATTERGARNGQGAATDNVGVMTHPVMAAAHRKGKARESLVAAALMPLLPQLRRHAAFAASLPAAFPQLAGRSVDLAVDVDDDDGASVGDPLQHSSDLVTAAMREIEGCGERKIVAELTKRCTMKDLKCYLTTVMGVSEAECRQYVKKVDAAKRIAGDWKQRETRPQGK